MVDFLFLATTSGLRTFECRPEEWHEADIVDIADIADIDRASDRASVCTSVAHTLAAQQGTSVSVQGNTLLAGTTEGLFCSNDLGRTWRPASVGMTTAHVRWVSYHLERPGVALVGTEPAAIFRTDDDAKTWRECSEVARLRDENGWSLPYSPEAGCVRGFAFHGDRAYAAVEQGGLLRSDDCGQTWRLAEGSSGNPHEPLPEGFIHNDVHSVSIHPASPDVVVAPTGGGLYRSVDGGETWTCLYECYCRAVWIDPDDPDQMIFGPADGVDENGRVEATFDGGVSWHPTADGLGSPWPHHMVERFVRWGDELLAVLSNGHLVAASLTNLTWRRVLPEIDDVRAAAVTQGEG